jgi:hypothetical protein
MTYSGWWDLKNDLLPTIKPDFGSTTWS